MNLDGLRPMVLNPHGPDQAPRTLSSILWGSAVNLRTRSTVQGSVKPKPIIWGQGTGWIGPPSPDPSTQSGGGSMGFQGSDPSMSA